MALLDDLAVDWSADAEAFDVLYRRHKADLLAFCRSRLPDAGEAEDACQETFLRAYRAMPRFDRAQRMWPWLATIAANVCTDMRRRRRPSPLSAIDGRLPDRAVDPEADADSRAKVSLVGAAIRELPEAYRRSVYLADVEGWSYDAIARHERKSLASVRSNLMRGRTAFKSRVQALAEERGMWPLSAAVPFRWLPVRLRSRLLAWRDARGTDLAAVAAPGASTAVQAAVAAISLLGALVPGTMAVAGAQANSPVMHVELARTDAAPREPIASAPTAAPSASSPVVTNIKLAGGQRSVDGRVKVGPKDNSRTVWQGVEFDCRSEARRSACAALDVVLPRLP